KYVARAVSEVNEQDVLTTKNSGRGMLSVSPDQAVGATGENEALIQFNLKKAAAEGYAHGSKIQKRARERLDADGAFKVMDPIIYEGAEGRRRKKTKDPTFTGPIKYIDRTKGDPNTPGFKGGFVIAKDGKKYLAGKVQSIPDTTQATPPPNPEDEETRRQATRRKELRELGVVKVIEDYLRLNAGGARITDIAAHVRKTISDEKWQTIIGARTKSIAAVIKLFPDKFEFYDADKGGRARLVGDVESREADRANLRGIALEVVQYLQAKGGSARMAAITKDVGLRQGDRDKKLRGIFKGDWRRGRMHPFYKLFDDFFEIQDKPGGGVVKLKEAEAAGPAPAAAPAAAPAPRRRLRLKGPPGPPRPPRP
ncbi:MAG: hypothetical protein VXU48_03915, partial [Verrucomicrobiota bacterium]|nr:hypothetical protein [Verrucomicrobiota bacterium]